MKSGGEAVGYRMRAQKLRGAAYPAEVVTEGVLTRRMIQRDPELRGVGLSDTG